MGRRWGKSSRLPAFCTLSWGNSQAQEPEYGFKSSSIHLCQLGPWASYSTYSHLCCPICNMGLIIPITKGCAKEDAHVSTW